MELESRRERERPKNRWCDVVRRDLSVAGWRGENAGNRVKWNVRRRRTRRRRRRRRSTIINYYVKPENYRRRLDGKVSFRTFCRTKTCPSSTMSSERFNGSTILNTESIITKK